DGHREERELVEGREHPVIPSQQPTAAEYEDEQRNRGELERRWHPLRDEVREVAPRQHRLVVRRKVNRIRRREHARPREEGQREPAGRRPPLPRNRYEPRKCDKGC